MTNALSRVEHLTTQQIVDKDFLDGVRTTLALDNSVLQQLAVTDAKNREKLLDDKKAIDTKGRNFREGMQGRIYAVQAFSENDVKHARDLYGGCIKLLVFEKILNRQLQSRSNDSQVVDDLMY